MAHGKAVLVALSFIAVISKVKGQRLLFSANPVNLTENRRANEVITVVDDRLVYNPLTSYVIAGNSDEFKIHPESGSITAMKTFDYETDVTRYLLIIEKRLQTGEVDSRAILIINIINEEEAPECLQAEFTAGTESISIDENYPVLKAVYKVDAKDQDIDDILTYTLQNAVCAPAPDGKFFLVDNATGVVSLADPLDYDAGCHACQLQIRVTDRSNLFCEGTITINIKDLNDEVPVFERFPEDTIEVSENTLVGTIIATVKATDKDVGSKSSYSLSVPSEVFALHPATGTLTLLKKLDFDNPDNPTMYPLLIEATDNDATHTASYTLTIAVTSEPPICDPRFSSGLSLIVRENFPVNEVVYTVLAHDPDGDTVKFKLLNSSHHTKVYFYLNEDLGVISTTDVALDYEKDPKIFRMVISATNTKMVNAKSCTGMLTFNIMNENDEAPVFKNSPEEPITLNEELPAGSLIFALQATDKDIDDTVHYEFVDIYKGFSINEDTGHITLSSRMDSEDGRHPPVRVVHVRAYDNDRVHPVTTQLSLSLLDVNDNSPRCEGNLIIIQLPETTPIDTSLLQLKCTDDDVSPPNNVLEYSMDLDAYSLNKFKLAHNEIILGPKRLDYDNLTFSGMQFKHTLIVRVSDKGEPSLTSTATVIVRVTRVNEFKPVPGNNVFTVVENSELGTLVGTVKFTDDDWPFNNLKYSVVAGDFGTPAKFYIEPNTGNVVVLNPLDREAKARYTASIQATDLNNDIEPDPLKQLKTIAVIAINIQNVNDEPPVCNPAHYETFIHSTNTAPFLQLQCSDKDSPNNQLSYAITSGNGIHRFTLLRTENGPPFLATRQNFQYNLFEGIQDPTVFQLLIEVTDEQGGNTALQLTTTATVIVHVTSWTTTMPTKPSVTSAIPMTTSVLLKYAYVWNPDNWFPALLAITGVLLLLCLYALAWGILKDVPKYASFFPQCHGCKKGPQPNTFGKSNIGQSKAETIESQLKKYEKSTTSPENVFPSALFDGRAIDIASGRHYLFNSQTGEVQWLN